MKTPKTLLNIADMNMVIFTIGIPVVVLVIIGIVYGGKPASAKARFTFLEQSFGALCSISICAAA